MAGEKIVQNDPGVGARVIIRTAEGGGDVANAWGVLVDWGAGGDSGRALDILSREAGSMARARQILASGGIRLAEEVAR